MFLKKRARKFKHKFSDVEEQWRSQPELAHIGGVHSFVLYHLNATTDDDFAGEFGVVVGVSGLSPDEEPDDLPLHSVVVGVEASTGRRLNNALFDATEARQLAAHLMDAADEVDELDAQTWTPEAKEQYVAQMARALFPKLTDAQLVAGGLTEDEVRKVHDKMRDESN